MSHSHSHSHSHSAHACSHDHSDERALLEKPDAEKIALAEESLLLGRAWLREGLGNRAARCATEGFGFLDYAFPTKKAQLLRVDDLTRELYLLRADGLRKQEKWTELELMSRNKNYLIERRVEALLKTDDLENASELIEKHPSELRAWKPKVDHAKAVYEKNREQMSRRMFAA